MSQSGKNMKNKIKYSLDFEENSCVKTVELPPKILKDNQMANKEYSIEEMTVNTEASKSEALETQDSIKNQSKSKITILRTIQFS